MSRTSSNRHTNRRHKDALFRMVFNDRKELLSLYNALAGTHYEDPALLEINTLENAIFIGVHNDLSFIIDGTLNLYEHQSTVNPNMPLRGLFYFSDLYKQIYYSEELFKSKQVSILTPAYIVLYNGINDIPDRLTLRLSDSFIHQTDTPDLEVVAHVININPGHNEELQRRCRKLQEYSIFVARVNAAAARSRSAEEFQKQLFFVMEQCAEDDILADIVTKERRRIMNMITGEVDIQNLVKVERRDAYEDGYDAGRGAGRDEGHIEAYFELYMSGAVTRKAILSALKIDIPEFNRLLEAYKATHGSR